MRLILHYLFRYPLAFSLVAGAFFISKCADGAEYRLLEAERLDFTVTKFLCNKEPMAADIPCHEWKGRTAVNFDLSFADLVKWRNHIHAEGTDAKYETVGWQFELALPVLPQVEIIYQHHSQHTMDRPQSEHHTDGTRAWKGFPVQDSYGVRMCFLGNCKQ